MQTTTLSLPSLYECLSEEVPPSALSSPKVLHNLKQKPLLSMFHGRHVEEEATVIALILRHTLETQHHTALLVAPDSHLVRHVCQKLKRWDVDVKDLQNPSLKETSIGNLFRLAVNCVVEDCSVVMFFALAKHPLTSCQRDPEHFQHLIAHLEHCFRISPLELSPNIEGLRKSLKAYHNKDNQQPHLLYEIDNLLEKCQQSMTLFASCLSHRHTTLFEKIKAHVEFVVYLTATDTQTGHERLWMDEYGKEMSEFLYNCSQESQNLTIFPTAEEYSQLFSFLLSKNPHQYRYQTFCHHA